MPAAWTLAVTWMSASMALVIQLPTKGNYTVFVQQYAKKIL